MSRLLLVEDDVLVGTMVQMNLNAQGHEVEWARDGEAGLRKATTAPYDLVLLDIGLPRLNGLEVLAALRERGHSTPVLMLTAVGDVRSKVKALDLGADDYLAKPFDNAELVARVRALVRRSQAEREVPSSRVVVWDQFEVDLDTRLAITLQGEATLGEKEAAILELLVRADGRPVSRADILEEVWGMDASPTERTVDNYLLRLRKLFEADPASPIHILTVRGTGYRFVP